ncbi:MAG TPA: PAS domain S-box protein [Mariprofundaceae bacterium]|nr:PAS domain S-box protein [Mariprofundaceae bacterium]
MTRHPAKNQAAHIAELEKRVAVLEEAARQTDRVREQWHNSIEQLTNAKAALQANETKYRLLHDNAFDAIILADRYGTIVETNPAASRIFGRDPHAMTGLHVDQLIPEALREHYHAEAPRHLDTHKALEIEALRQDSTTFPAEILLSTLSLNDEPLFTATIRDITERKRAEAALTQLNEELEEKVRQRTKSLEQAGHELKAQKEHFQAIINNSIVGIGVIDTQEFRYLLVNEAYASILGCTPDELIGKSLLEFTHPDDIPENRDKLHHLATKAVRHYRMEKRFARKDGQTVWGDVSASLISAMPPASPSRSSASSRISPHENR